MYFLCLIEYMCSFHMSLIFELDDDFVRKGFQLVNKKVGPGDCGTSLGCAYGNEAAQIQRCESKGCNLIQWCPYNGEGLDYPSCHSRYGGKSRACLYKNCNGCYKSSCNYRSPSKYVGSKRIGHWYTYFKGSNYADPRQSFSDGETLR